MLEILDTLVEEFIIAAIMGVALVVINHFRNKSKDHDIWKTKYEKEQAEHRRAIWRINKTLIIFAKIIDAQTEKVHPEITTQLEDITEELLEESNNEQNRS